MIDKTKLNGKNLITIGIYSAIYFAINFIFMILGGFHPILWILMPGFIALFSALPLLILEKKVPKFGCIYIVGAITSLIYYLTGQFTLIIVGCFIIFCTLAEFIRFKTHYKSYIGNAVAFSFFSLGMVGSPLPIWLFKDDFFAKMINQGMSHQYVNQLSTLSSNFTLFLLFFFPIVTSIIGVLVAHKMIEKHFKKSGNF